MVRTFVSFQSAENIDDQNMNVLFYYNLRCLTVAMWFLIAIQIAKRRCDITFPEICRYKNTGEIFRMFRENKRLLISAEPLLRSLHWLPVRQRINFKLAKLCYLATSFKQP